jgi:hypothetical protein
MRQLFKFSLVALALSGIIGLAPNSPWPGQQPLRWLFESLLEAQPSSFDVSALESPLAGLRSTVVGVCGS